MVKCDVCHKPFEHGDEYLHLQRMAVGQSQGYEDHFPKFTVNCCKECADKAIKLVVQNGQSS